ncbi:MAG: hypothetical protein ACOZAM_25465 [Pseudomonadota bacterium]
MTMQYSTAVRNARLDIVETTIGASPILQIRSGAPPVNCAATDNGTVLATVVLPADWMAAASGGTKSKSGTWQDLSADASGTAGHFRLKDGSGTTTHMQGTCTITGGGGDMILDNTNFAIGQVFTVVNFTLTAGNP